MKNDFFNVKSRELSLELKLLNFWFIVNAIWTLFVGLLSFALKLPLETCVVYSVAFIGIILLFLLYRIPKLDFIFREIYYVAIFFMMPFLWYYSGGGRTSANILFVLEIIIYTMCLSGIEQKVYIISSLFSINLVQRIAANLPNPVFIMSERQYSIISALVGMSTSIMIATVLIKQKREYKKERDAAINSERELIRSNVMQKNFLANMSHEIRSPLGIVMGFNNLICESSDIDQIHEYSKDISQAGTTLLAVINDILDYSKIESGKLTILEVDYSFADFMEEIKKDIGLKCQEKGLKFVSRNDDTIPNSLYGDNIRIKQCMINVLSNAVKYTQQGVVIFNVLNEGMTDDGKYIIKYIIKDTGKGISAEAIPHLYSAFQRLDEGTNRGIEGTGLGLAITKNLLDEMGGTIEVESELGKGTTFTITLRQKEGNYCENTSAQAGNINLNGVKVLVVDDTQMNLTIVKKLLENEGATVTTVDNGKDSISIAADTKFDIILLDHMMPGMNGIEVFEQIKDPACCNSTTPIVMLTANAMAGVAKEYMDIGFDGYLSKPILPNELKETINNLTFKN